eukprot:CAMPEP_0204363162 /NCGR_PEP_ID=MMETSP0469-20131031/40161_1 /ASSEMBLY_ACC=CAM_ASM_000384 /TAXON_ID=2969 /ORGANISM="Oxyrrhis marina" /LENGTH=834 /DNA_ID=CAMNT_0051351871 /DNA_START=29 /DNA_END=2533 /DNA_ORIENTATION=-
MAPKPSRQATETMESGPKRIPPFHYMHILDSNTNVTMLIEGPLTYNLEDHQQIVAGPLSMVILSPGEYCMVGRPVVRAADGTPQRESQDGPYKLRHGDKEVRLGEQWAQPFVLYPGEYLETPPTPMPVVRRHQALHLRAIQDCEVDGVKRVAGDEWQFKGPGTYAPRREVEVYDQVEADVVKAGQALRLKAKRECVDSKGVKRPAGQEWLHREPGVYLLSVNEECIGWTSATVITERQALHIKAKCTFTDVYGVVRKAGAEWLVTHDMSTSHFLDVDEELVRTVPLTTLRDSQYCLVRNPMKKGVQLRGQREMRQGPLAFFLAPFEDIDGGIQDVHCLDENAALLLRAEKTFTEGKEERTAGDTWLLPGPLQYVPPIEVTILEVRNRIPLDENEGIYVRDLYTGKVRTEMGPQSYLLKNNEELWEKDLPEPVEILLANGLGMSVDDLAHCGVPSRDKTKVVSCRVPHNAAMQVYDFYRGSSRVAYGPDLVSLGPDEYFSVLTLSGSTPKTPNKIKSLFLRMGPDFMTDVVEVETLDHARLRLKVAYNWHFQRSETEAGRIFNVRDFVGDVCKAVASRIRGNISQVAFDAFHQDSAEIIKAAVFGRDKESKVVRDSFVFDSNGLTITSIDVQQVEPVDLQTQQSLQRAVQVAIEVTTAAQEAEARHKAAGMDQVARGQLQRQKIHDETAAEEVRLELIEKQTLCTVTETQGQASAEAQARAEAALIHVEAEKVSGELRGQALRIEHQEELRRLKAAAEEEIEDTRLRMEMEVQHMEQMAKVEADKFAAIMEAIGQEALVAIAAAGPELRKQLLTSLGVTDVMPDHMGMMGTVMGV